MASILSLVTIATLAVSLFALRSTSALPRLKEEETVILSNIALLHTKTAKTLFISDRLGSASEIERKRTAFDHTLDQLLQSLPQNVSLNNLRLDKKSATITVSAPSLVVIDTFIENVSQLLVVKKLFKKILVSGVAVDLRNASYTISLEGEFL